MFGADDEIGETLETENGSLQPKKSRKTLFIIIGVCAIILIAGIGVGLYFLLRKKDIKVDIFTIPIPDGVIIDDGHYLYDGNIFINYKRSNSNFQYFGVMADDGSNFKELYGAEFIVRDKANGIRVIPFRDNKRVYLGDYVFECSDNTKTIRECDKGVLIPVNYPSSVDGNQYTMKTWSEMVVAPDNILNMACGAINFLGKFKREENSYEIVDSKIISTIKFLEIP